MTIKEIAVLANTSRGTVDRVVNGRGKVRKDVEERILKVIEETKYTKSEVGKVLSQHKEYKIGVVIGSDANSFFSLISEGIYREMARYKNYGFIPIYKKVDIYNKNSVLKALKELTKENLSGLIVSCLNHDDVVFKINQFDCPVVALNINNDSHKLSYVGSDYYNCGALMANFANLVFKENARCVIVLGSLLHSGQKQRLDGFKAKVRQDIKILDIKENYDSLLKAKDVVRDAINENKEGIDYFIFLGAGSTGGIRVIRENNKLFNTNIKALTVDQSYEIERALNEGLVLGTITQHPYTQGVKAVDAFYDFYIREAKVDSLKIIESSVILKESYIPHKLNRKDNKE